MTEPTIDATAVDAVSMPFRFADDLGPAKIVHVTERTTGLRATIVIDNLAMGPAIGGLRMAPER